MEFYIEDDFEIHPSVYIAPTARIYGKVKIGANTSVWDGAVIRGDLAPVEIGENTSIQENVVVHVDIDLPCYIGNNVCVGHGAIVHGATVGNNCIIAISSTILNNSRIGDNSVIGAGSVVMERKVIPPNSVVFGSPGKVIKKINEDMQNTIRRNAMVYVELGAAYLAKMDQNKSKFI